MRAHLGDYLKEIDDLMTSSGSVEQYADFCGTLMLIQSFTENLYMRREDGSFPPLDADHKEALQEQYRDAIEQAVDLGEQESATVGGAMSSRQHMYVESGRLGADGRPTVEEGYFTPTRRIEPRKDLDAVLERMIAKHPKYRLLPRARPWAAR